jgi:hypothetical protein
MDYSIETAKCDKCSQTKPCLIVDNSQGEYREVKLCQDCINNLF